MSRAFRYELAPLLLTRQWRLQALLIELAREDESLRHARAQLAMLLAVRDRARLEWGALGSAQPLNVQTLARYTAYFGDLDKQAARRRRDLTDAETRHGALAAQVVTAKRALEAVERHRDGLKAGFVRERASAEFKVADEQWNSRPGRQAG